MIVFRMGKTKIIFNFGFFLALSLFCLIDTKGMVICTFCSCIVHEIGHILATVLCDMKIEKISFGFGGIKMTPEKKIKSLGSDILILLSGPFFNVLSALCYYHSECYTAFSINLILAFFNLLPFSSLDGGLVIRKIIEYFQLNADFYMKLIAVISALAVCVFLYICNVKNVFVYGIIIFLCFSEFFY